MDDVKIGATNARTGASVLPPEDEEEKKDANISLIHTRLHGAFMRREPVFLFIVRRTIAFADRRI